MAKKKKEFEDIMVRMEEIVAKLEEGSLSLEESVALYKEGMTLSMEGRGMLDTAAQEVAVLKQTAEGLCKVPFAVEDTP